MAYFAARNSGDTGSRLVVLVVALWLSSACTSEVGGLAAEPRSGRAAAVPAGSTSGDHTGVCDVGVCPSPDAGTPPPTKVGFGDGTDAGTPPPPQVPTGPILYVATGGSDGNPGTEAKPLLSFARASALAKPGTTIYVRAGTFQINQMVNARGTADAPIVFEPYPGESVRIDGTDLWLSTSSSLLYVTNAAFVTLRGFEILHSNMRGVDVYNSHDIRVEGFNIHDMQYSAIAGESDNMTFDSNEISNVQLANKYNDNPGTWGSGLATWLKSDGSWVKNLTVTNNSIHDAWGECMIALFVDTAVIRGNRIHDCWSMNLYLDHVRNVTVDRNYLYATSDTYNRPSMGMRGTGLGFAIEPDGGATSEVLDTVTVTNNLISSTGLGISFWGSSGNWDVTNTYRNLHIENNVIYNTGRAAIAFDAVISGASAPTGNTLRNNVIPSGALDGAVLRLGNADGWTVQNNDFPSGIPSMFLGYGNFEKWPKFVNPGPTSEPAGFQLQVGSPCIEAGYAGGVSRQDFWGVERSLSHPSVGIHEPG